MGVRQTIRVAGMFAILMVTALVSAAGCYVIGWQMGYDQGFDQRVERQLQDAANATPIDWSAPENQAAAKRAFPAAFPSVEPSAK